MEPKVRRRSLLVNSSVAFVLAGIIATTTHEVSHLVAGLIVGESGTLFATSVEFAGERSVSDQITTAATGPIFSLVSGLLLIFVSREWGRGFGRLLWMWVGFMSAQIGFGYFLIAPFATVGDTGRVLALLEAPPIASWVSLALGMVGTLLLSALFARRVVAYSDGTDESMRAFGIFSWLIGTGVLVVIYLPAAFRLPPEAVFISLLGVVAAGIFAPMFSFFYRLVHVEAEPLELRVPTAGIVGLVVAALIVIVPLGIGVPFG
ncbi:hypothetical protein C5B85_14645 [Pseudoclavibacter sp. AY1F1]|uniref:hypothetical protein n=1 Tax=Pseudoclavibacter sp. AY1F1 TaxID=2080583 RepID=UPI000CE87EF8|nr:hypothetical protein [Pseudoclavibacter sp. AY1F1]PPF43182.1 hypothetical protein C5B85_14645 [Pseudoclavibacter sp. AY1F1]